MTPEEKAVIDAAIEWDSMDINSVDCREENELGIAVRALLAARRVEEQGAPDEMLWVERTWRDVRAGDTVRPPGSDATAVVKSSVTQDWHVDPRWKTDKQYEYHPVPLDHTFTWVLFAGEKQNREMNPDAPVEIWIERDAVHVHEMLGWADRIATITEEG